MMLEKSHSEPTERCGRSALEEIFAAVSRAVHNSVNKLFMNVQNLCVYLEEVFLGLSS